MNVYLTPRSRVTLQHGRNLANNIGGGANRPGFYEYSASRKTQGFCFLSLHNPNNRLENIRILYLPLFDSVPKEKYS